MSNYDNIVKRAANHINAVALSDGRYAHRDDAMARWYVVTVNDLAELCEYLDHTDEQISSDAYSHWCAGTIAEEMPEDWTPKGAVNVQHDCTYAPLDTE